MPFYEYTCPECLTKYVCRRSMDNRDVPFLCGGCGRPCRRQIAVPEVLVKGNMYVGQGNGKYGRKKRAHKAKLREGK